MNQRLPGLDAIRLYAALSVVAYHSVTSGNALLTLFLNGPNAVTVFFVLSGYLISYRLLKEREHTGHIDLKAFYIRRELRILPLYYGIALLGIVVIPLLGGAGVPVLPSLKILLLAPQLAHPSGESMGVISHLWSIGVEELFYLVFPFLICRFAFLRVTLAVIVVTAGVSWLATVTGSNSVRYLGEMRFECMGVGALAAWLVVRRSRWLYVLYHPAVQFCSIALLLVLLTYALPFPWFDLIFSCLVAIILVNISTNPRRLLTLDTRWSRGLGNLTYGIYMWHFPISCLLLPWLSDWPLFWVLIVVTVPIAALSYRFLERPFLRLKDRARPQPILAPTGD